MLQCCVRLLSIICSVGLSTVARRALVILVLPKKLSEEVNTKWPMGNQMVHLTDDVTIPYARAQYLENSYLANC